MKSLGSEVKNWLKFSSGLWGEQRLNFLLGHKESTPCDIPDIQTQSRIREDVWHTHDHIVRKNLKKVENQQRDVLYYLEMMMTFKETLVEVLRTQNLIFFNC